MTVIIYKHPPATIQCVSAFTKWYGMSVCDDMDIQTEVAWDHWQHAWNASKLDSDREQAENERLVDEVNEARKETGEQARLNGMGAEREARLMAENAELKAKLAEKAYLLRCCYARINVLEKALTAAHDHIDMAALEVSHCKDAATIRAALEKKHEGT